MCYNIPDRAEIELKVNQIIYNSYDNTLKHYLEMNNESMCLIFNDIPSNKHFGFDPLKGNSNIELRRDVVFTDINSRDLYNSRNLLTEYKLPDVVYVSLISIIIKYYNLCEQNSKTRDELTYLINKL